MLCRRYHRPSHNRCHSPQMSRRYAVFGRFLIYPLQHTTELVDLVHSRPNSRYYVDAFDFYHDGTYQYTRYLVLSL